MYVPYFGEASFYRYDYFLEKFSLLSRCQYGFIAPATNVARKLCCHSFFENHVFPCVLFLDVAKAFDSISHKIMVYKLQED